MTDDVMLLDAETCFKRLDLMMQIGAPGDFFTYYIGDLAREHPGRTTGYAKVREKAYQGWLDGRLHLTQKRAGNGVFHYIATVA